MQQKSLLRWLTGCICWLACLHVFAQPVSIHFADQAVFTIHKVSLANVDVQAWKGDHDQLKSMFHTYQYPDHIDAYKGIFYKDQYPAHIDEVFADWSQKMKQSELQVEAIFYGNLDSTEIACIQFYFTQVGYKLQLSFLAKRVEGIWYPMNTSENARYQPVIGLFGTLSPHFIAALIYDHTGSKYADAAAELMSLCSFDQRAITEACIEQAAISWGTGDAAAQEKEQLLFKKRMQAIVPADDHEKALATEQYVLTLGLPDDATRTALYYLKRQEGLKAVGVMYANGLEKPQSELFEELNQAIQTDLYKHIEYKIQEKPSSN